MTQEEAASAQSTTESESLSKRILRFLKTILVTLGVALFLKTFVVEAYRIPTGSMENTLLVGDFLVVNKFAYGLRTPRYLPFTSVALPTLTIPIFGKLRRGDVAIFEYPGEHDATSPEPLYYIKRCIGLPGDKVEIRKGQVFVNDESFQLPSTGKPATGAYSAYHHDRYHLYPPGTTFTDYNYGPVVLPARGQLVELRLSDFDLWKTLIAREGHSVASDARGLVYVDGHPRREYTVEHDYYFMMGDHRDNSLDSRYWGFVPDDNLVGEAMFIYWSWDSDISVSRFSQKVKSIRWNRIGTLIR